MHSLFEVKYSNKCSNISWVVVSIISITSLSSFLLFMRIARVLRKRKMGDTRDLFRAHTKDTYVIHFGIQTQNRHTGTMSLKGLRTQVQRDSIPINPKCKPLWKLSCGERRVMMDGNNNMTLYSYNIISLYQYHYQNVQQNNFANVYDRPSYATTTIIIMIM